MKSPNFVGGSTSVKPAGINKMFSSNVLSPEALAELTITPDSTADSMAEMQNSTVLSGLSRRVSLGPKLSSSGSTNPPPKVVSSAPSNIKLMDSIVEDNEDAESRDSSRSRRSSITKKRLEDGGYQGGVNPFSSEVTSKSGTNERRKSLLTSDTGASTLKDSFSSSIGDPSAPPNASRRRSFMTQLSTFAEEVGPPDSGDENQTGISQSLVESTSPADTVNFGYTKDRFSMDISETWYKSSFSAADKQSTVNNAPVSEYAFVPMAHETAVQGSGGKSSGRRLSIIDRSPSTPVSAGGNARRRSLLDVKPIKSSSSLGEQEGSPPLNDNQTIFTTEPSLVDTSVHNGGGTDAAADLNHIDSYENPIEDDYIQHSDSVPVIDYDASYVGEYGGSPEQEEGAQATGGYYLATDGNYYYYEDDDYYGTADEAYEGEYDTQQNDELWEQRTGFLSAIKEGDISLRRTPATEKYMDVRGEVLAQIRSGAVNLKKMQPTTKPSTEQVRSILV